MMVIMWVMYQKAEINEVWKGHCWNTTVSNEEDVDDRKRTSNGAKDNMHNFIIEVEKKFDEARGKKKDLRVQQDGNVLNGRMRTWNCWTPERRNLRILMRCTGVSTY